MMRLMVPAFPSTGMLDVRDPLVQVLTCDCIYFCHLQKIVLNIPTTPRSGGGGQSP
jgi:hypothetical protein